MMNAMKNKLIYVLFIGILLFPLFGYSQTFRGLSVSDGLSDLVVNALYKDSTGYVWIGTSSTLERFDGVRLKHYAIPVTNEKTACEVSTFSLCFNASASLRASRSSVRISAVS